VEKTYKRSDSGYDMLSRITPIRESCFFPGSLKDFIHSMGASQILKTEKRLVSNDHFEKAEKTWMKRRVLMKRTTTVNKKILTPRFMVSAAPKIIFSKFNSG
jgi:hypothetical protein